MTVYEQVKKALQDLLVPELRGIKEESKRLCGRIGAITLQMDKDTDPVGKKVATLRNELLAEIRRVDAGIESLQREVRVSLEIRERLSALEAKVGILRG